MSRRITRPVPTPAELVAPFASPDKARTNLNTPFGFQSRHGPGYVAATDGHRAALVKSPEWPMYERVDAPPLCVLVPWDAPRVGELRPCDFSDGMLSIPRSWSVAVNLASPTTSASVSKIVSKGRGTSIVYPFGREPIEPRWPGMTVEGLGYPLWVHLSYLIDACAFIGTGVVQVRHGGGIDPIVLLPPDALSVREAERFMIVMPRRP